jgi:hypothetical protein
MSDHQHEPYDVYGLDGTRQDAREALALVAGLREDLGRAEERIRALEAQTPQTRKLQYEADLAAADLASSGYDRDPPIGADRHGPGCLCPYCPDDEPEPGDAMREVSR